MSQSSRSFAFHMLLALAVGACSIVATTLMASAALIPTSTFTMAQATAPGAFYVTDSGRFRFEQFSFNAVPPGDPTPNANNIFITVSETSNMVMLLFQIVGNNVAMPGTAWDLQIGYRAIANNPLDQFVGHTLSMNSAALGDAGIGLNEVIFSGDGQLLTTTPHFLRDNLGNNGVRVLSDTVDFVPPQTVVDVDKDLFVTGGTENGGGTAFISHFKQTFHVEPIPEPSSIALLMLGLTGLGMVGRISRRKRG